MQGPETQGKTADGATPEQRIQTLAKLQFSQAEIAAALELDPAEAAGRFADPASSWAKAFRRGLLLGEVQARRGLFEAANKGNVQAAREAMALAQANREQHDGAQRQAHPGHPGETGSHDGADDSDRETGRGQEPSEPEPAHRSLAEVLAAARAKAPALWGVRTAGARGRLGGPDGGA